MQLDRVKFINLRVMPRCPIYKLLCESQNIGLQSQLRIPKKSRSSNIEKDTRLDSTENGGSSSPRN